MGAYERPLQCGDILITDVEYDRMNINDPVNFGWQDESLTANCGDSYVISDTFRVEDSGGDSGNCGGSNNHIQSGTCDIWIYLPSTKTVTLSVEGNTERQNQPFDFGLIYVDGAADPEVWVSGTQEGRGCDMMVHNSSVCPYNTKCQEALLPCDLAPNICQYPGHIPEVQTTLGAGVHHIQFKVDTCDERYHVGEYFNFSVTIQNP